MIVLEGPDGAGKTTLLRDLRDRYPEVDEAPRFSTSKGGPIDRHNLRRRVDLEFESQIDAAPRLYDRHPVISETIYGPVLRRDMLGGFDDRWLITATARLRNTALIVWCLPPLPTVLANLAAEDQMDGVHESIHTLYWLYHAKAMQWAGNSVIYDYTRTNALSTVLDAIDHHLEY